MNARRIFRNYCPIHEHLRRLLAKIYYFLSPQSSIRRRYPKHIICANGKSSGVLILRVQMYESFLLRGLELIGIKKILLLLYFKVFIKEDDSFDQLC